jgi:hypothetical protein
MERKNAVFKEKRQKESMVKADQSMTGNRSRVIF